MSKKHRIKVWILIVVIWLMWFSDFSFAAESNNFEVFWLTLNYIVSALAWIWIFFAKVAWEFLTNKWVYGEVFWWDALLWKFRNIMKNIANFWLGFFLVYMILKWLVDQYNWKEITKNLKDTILWTLIAWVWIQASWFLTAAVIDVSTVTLVAAWSFPSQIVSNSEEVEVAMKASLSKFLSSDGKVVEKVKKISLFPETAWVTNLFKVEYVPIDAPQDVTWIIEKILPKDNVRGPLYFMWFSILETDLITSPNTTKDESIKATIFNTLMQWWTTIIFSIEMFVLCIIAVMRIVYLWMFIALSPLAVLLWCIKQSWQKLWDSESFASKLMRQINFNSFFINAFKPTIIVLCIWIAAILVSLMTSVMKKYMTSGEEFSYKWVTFSSRADDKNTNDNPWDQTYTTTMDSDLIHFTLTNAWKTLLGFVLSIITVIIVYQIIKIGVMLWWKDSHDFVTKNIGKIQKSLGDLMMSMPVVPVSWYDKQGVETTKFITADQILRLDGEWGVLWGVIDKYGRNQVHKEMSDQQKIIDNLLSGGGITPLTKGEERIIREFRTMNKRFWLDILREQKNTIQNLARTNLQVWESYWMTLNPDSQNKFWIEEFEAWLTEMHDGNIDLQDQVWNNIVKSWDPNNITKDSLKILFWREPNRVQAYATLFDLWQINTWEDLQNADFSEKKQ